MWWGPGDAGRGKQAKVCTKKRLAAVRWPYLHFTCTENLTRGHTWSAWAYTAPCDLSLRGAEHACVECVWQSSVGVQVPWECALAWGVHRALLGACTSPCATRVHRLRCKGRVFAAVSRWMDGWLVAPSLAACEDWSAQCAGRRAEAALAQGAVAPCSTVWVVGADGSGFRLLLAVGPGVVLSH